MFWRISNFHTILQRVAVFLRRISSSDISEHGTHFLASAFPNLATRSEVAYLLCVLLLQFLSWQGLPWTAQQGHLPPTAICAQVLQIPHSLSTFPSLLSQSSLSSFNIYHFKHIHTCACIAHTHTTHSEKTHYCPQSAMTAEEFHISYKWQLYFMAQKVGHMLWLFKSVMFYWGKNKMCMRLTVRKVTTETLK